MKYYKLTNSEGKTYNDTKWGNGVTHRARKAGNNLCSDNVIHVYDHPLKAAMFNPIHANFLNPLLWKCHVKKIVADDGLKVGVKQCTTIEQVPLPEITTNQRVHFAILCALEVYQKESFVKWAKAWLSGENRTRAASEAAARAAWAAWVSEAASEAAADAAARAAVRAAEAAAAKAAHVDFLALIKKALKETK